MVLQNRPLEVQFYAERLKQRTLLHLFSPIPHYVHLWRCLYQR